MDDLEKPENFTPPAVDAPEEDRVKNVMVGRMEEQFRQYAGANLRIDEAQFLVIDEKGGIEYRCFTESDAEDLATQRVERVGGIHVIYQRHAVVRPPRPQVIVEK